MVGISQVDGSLFYSPAAGHRTHSCFKGFLENGVQTAPSFSWLYFLQSQVEVTVEEDTARSYYGQMYD